MSFVGGDGNMVELCELQRMRKDVDYWPADIDQHVAQLEFDTSSSMMIEQSLYASSTTGGVDVTGPDEDDEEEEDEENLDGEDQRFRIEELAAVAAVAELDAVGSSAISTDSLDMDLIRDCSGAGDRKNRRNDYKLIFEDSGQWTTTSGIGASFTTNGATTDRSPPARRRSARHASQKHLASQQTTPRLRYETESNCLASGRMLDRHFGLRLLEQLNNDEWAEAVGEASDEEKQRLIGQLLSNIMNSDDASSVDDRTGPRPMTTWGRIRSTQPYDAKTYSMQYVDGNEGTEAATRRPFSCADMPQYCALNRSGGSDTSGHSKASRTSLLANFVEQQELRNRSDGNGYEYSETYVGNGRYVDVNENEIGYVPESTAPIQCSASSHAPPSKAAAPLTHFDIPPSFTAPDLKFLSLTHKAPSFCRSQISLDEMLRRARNGSLLLSENLFSDEKVALLADAVCPMTTQEQMGLFERHNGQPDSGLGSSSTSGPSHIEDWASLAILLPKHIVDACSFFKTNSSLLTGSGSNASGSLNNIERKLSTGGVTSGAIDFDAVTCRTCFSVRRRRLHPQPWAHKAPATAPKTALCDCVACCCCCMTSAGVTSQTVSEIVTPKMCRYSSTSRHHRLSHSASTTSAAVASALTARVPKLNAAELSVVGLPLYSAKRALVERVVEGVAEIARGASAIVLYSALTRLLADGLLENRRPWTVIVAVTGNGPATNTIFDLVKRLEASEKSENSRIDHFFKELLSSNSLDGWFSYVVLKENVLTRMYAETAFLLRANSAYRSLFLRLIESVELLSVLSQCNRHQAQRRRDAAFPSSNHAADGWQGASRLPSDSRIPKSSSIPEKLTPNVYSENVAADSYTTPKPRMDTPATLPRGKNASSTQGRRLASRIPIASPTSARSMTQYGALLYNPASTLRTRSLHARTATPTALTARVRERVAECDVHDGGRLLPLEKGEMVRVLSTRGDMSRCCRLHMRFGMLLNGIVPTQKLDFC